MIGRQVLAIWLATGLLQSSTLAIVDWVSMELGRAAPPIPGLYDCTKELKDRPLDMVAAQGCLDRILRTGYFSHGGVSVEQQSPGKVGLIFKLETPELVVTELIFQAGDPDGARLPEWLAKDPETLNVGDFYDWGRDAVTESGIGYFFKTQGRLTALTVTRSLDFNRRTARIVYKIYEGPRVPDEAAPPPFGAECDRYVGSRDWSDLSDTVPEPLVERLVRLKMYPSCYSDEQLAADQTALLGSGLFDSAEYKVEGPSEAPQMHLKVRAKPFVVRNVQVLGFGILAEQDLSKKIQIPVRENELYSRSNSIVSRRLLAEAFAKDQGMVDVVEDVQALPGHELKVCYYVIAAPKGKLEINGKTIPIS